MANSANMRDAVPPPEPPHYPWEGPHTFVRRKVGRSSAAGGTFHQNPWHVLAGLTSDGKQVSQCGLAFEVHWNTRRPKGDEPICARCEVLEALSRG